ncbi:hypothetical protein TgHK011_003631 [Trichoderma gracile]|nr:hypothetical protein TgHK011_003631 [Trichoderma gracile]
MTCPASSFPSCGIACISATTATLAVAVAVAVADSGFLVLWLASKRPTADPSRLAASPLAVSLTFCVHRQASLQQTARRFLDSSARPWTACFTCSSADRVIAIVTPIGTCQMPACDPSDDSVTNRQTKSEGCRGLPELAISTTAPQLNLGRRLTRHSRITTRHETRPDQAAVLVQICS